ncbi:hypothetical protein MLD38_039241 [Melastoma candidum]|uniref:Uncharacterized protein n=1 Tax=Melastoma candidum TaxID=119954 RepID=A0ACB9L1H2_9MYRT|nr:hypothetical protein MLD38_039241 [Melastoma candidum]
MLSRAFILQKRSPNKHGDGRVTTGSGSILQEYEDCLVGFMDDLPLSVVGEKSIASSWLWNANSKPTLREVLRASVGVIGESSQGITEKIVFLDGKVCTLKRFRVVGLRKREYRRRLQRLAQISVGCEYLVPVRAYLYTKRIKFVLCDYYPMGSLTDLLSGARDYDHTALDWNQRLKIMFTTAQAISFIHSQSPSQDKKMQMNVHRNIKSSNIMINVDFTACLSEYGFVQLADQAPELHDTGQHTIASPAPDTTCRRDLRQPGDIYDFGLVMLEMVAGLKARDPSLAEFVRDNKEDIREGRADFFDFPIDDDDRKVRNQALDVLDIALACIDKAEGSRPRIKTVLQRVVVCDRYHQHGPKDMSMKMGAGRSEGEGEGESEMYFVFMDYDPEYKRLRSDRSKRGVYELDEYVSKKHDDLLASVLEPGSYKKTLSLVIVDGFAVEISEDQARMLRSANGVRVVEKNQEVV